MILSAEGRQSQGGGFSYKGIPAIQTFVEVLDLGAL